MLDSMYHMKLKLFCNHVFGVKMSTFSQMYAMLSAAYDIPEGPQLKI